MKRYETQLKAQIEDVDDPELLTEVFCPRDSKSIRPRYAAIQLLIKEENGRRMVYNPEFDQNIMLQDWSEKISLLDVYNNVEKVEKPPPKSTIMVAAAFLMEKDDLLIRRLRPWGKDLDGSWEWEGVLEKDLKLKKRWLNIFA